MAYVVEVAKTSTSVTVRLEETDGSYPNDSRYLYWYITDNPDAPSDISTWLVRENLPSNATCSQEQTLDGLAPNTMYFVHCLVEWGGGSYEDGQGQWFNALEVTTLDTISTYLFSVEDNGDLTATCTWIVSGYSDTYTWLIQTDNGDYAGKESLVTNTRKIYFDAPGEYVVRFTVVDDVSGESYTTSESVIINDPNPPEDITVYLFSVEDNGDLTATCTWIVSGYSDTYTYLIQTDNGDYAGQESSVSNTRTIYFDSAGEYTVYFTVVDDVSGESCTTSESVIIAESEPEPETPWTLYGDILDRIDDCAHRTIDIKERSVYRYAVSVENDTRVYIYTSGKVGISLKISTSSSFDAINGAPTSILASSYFGLPNNNSVTYLDLRAGITRYVFVRSIDGGPVENVGLFFHLHSNGWHLQDYTYLNLSRGRTVRAEIGVGIMHRVAVSFTESGTATFTTTSQSYDTTYQDKPIGWLTKDTTWDTYNGYPSKVILSDTNANDEVSMAYEVVAGEVYYIWLRRTAAYLSGRVDLRIDPPGDDEPIAIWDWEIGTESEKNIAYRALIRQSGYSLSDFSYRVWNDLVNKVYDVAESATLDNSASVSGWLTSDDEGNTYLGYPDTLMSAGEDGRTLTAAKFNALKFNIGARESTGIPNQKPGDPVRGHYFVTLTECLNAWISKLNG